MKVVCAWCQRDGNAVIPREKAPENAEVSHGICDEHVIAVLAEARRRKAALSAAAGARVIHRRAGSLTLAHAAGLGRSVLDDGNQSAPVHVRGRLLLIVSQAAPTRFTYLKHLYGNDTVEVIVDRRVGQRRRRHELVVNERRRVVRRRRDVTEDLQNFGWTLVRH